MWPQAQTFRRISIFKKWYLYCQYFIDISSLKPWISGKITHFLYTPSKTWNVFTWSGFLQNISANVRRPRRRTSNKKTVIFCLNFKISRQNCEFLDLPEKTSDFLRVFLQILSPAKFLSFSRNFWYELRILSVCFLLSIPS